MQKPKKKFFVIFILIIFPFLLSAETGKYGKRFEELCNFIKEHYPYFGLRNVNWDEVVKNYRILVKKCRDDEEFIEILRNLTAELGDPHVRVVKPPLKVLRAGMVIEKIGGSYKILSVIKNSPAEDAGLKKGNEIIEIEGKTPDKFISSLPLYLRKPFQGGFLGKSGKKISLKYRNEHGEIKETEIILREIPEQQASKIEYRILEDNIGYIKIPTFGRESIVNDFDRALDSLREAKGIILDLRGNGGGDSFVAERIAGRFIEDTICFGKLVFVKPGFYRGTNIKNIRESVVPLYVRPRERIYKGKVCILMDRFCASTCEHFIISLKDSGRACLVGEPTAGACPGFMYNYKISKNIVVALPISTYHRSNGEVVEGKGIKPDFYVDQLSPQGEDPFLEKGLEVIKNTVPKFESSLRQEKSIAGKENFSDYMNQLAISCIEKGNINGAIEIWKKALAEDNNSFKINYNLSLVLFDLGKLEEAEIFCRQAIKCGDPECLSWANNLLGNILYKQERYYEALKEYRKAVERDKNSTIAHYNLGSTYHMLGDEDNAEKHWRLAVQLGRIGRKGEEDKEKIKGKGVEILVFVEERTAVFFARKSLGFLYENKGFKEKAIEEFESALELIPSDPEIHYELGKIYMSLKNKEKAIYHFECAIKNGTKNEKEARVFLKELRGR